MMECKDPKPFYSIGVSSVPSVTVPAETDNTVDGAQSVPAATTVTASKVDGTLVSEPVDNVPSAQQVVVENGISGIRTSFKSEAVMESVEAAVESNETYTSSLTTISTTGAAETAIMNANGNANVKIGQKDSESALEEPQIDSKSSIRIVAKESSQISESVPVLRVISVPETPQSPGKISEPMKIIKSEVTYDETVTAKIDDRSIVVTTRGIKREHQLDDSTVAEATVPIVVTPHPVTETTARIAESTVPVTETTATIAGSTVPVTEATAIVAESTVPVTETTATVAESTVPVTETTATVAESTVPVTETTATVAESTVPVTETTNLVVEKSASKSPKQKTPPKQKGKIQEVKSDVVIVTNKAKVASKASVAPVNVTSNGKRIRYKTQMYQAPLPEEDALLSKLSNSVHAKDNRVIVFKKLEFIAVRSPENSFFICRSLNNINKKSKKCRIQWLAKNDNEKGDVYTNDFYDVVDFETILTNVQMNRVNKNKFTLPPMEKERVQHILKKVLDVESGVAMPSTDNVDDGIDISQISNTTLDVSPVSKRSSRSTDNNESTVRKSRKRSVPTTKKRSASLSIEEPNSKSVRRSNRHANTSIAPVPVDEDEYEEMVPIGSRKRTTTANKRSTTKNVAAIPVSTSKSSTKSTKSTPKAVAVTAPKSNVKAAKKNITPPAVAIGASKKKTVSAAIEKSVAAGIAESKKGRRAAKAETNLPAKSVTATNNKKNEPKTKAAPTVADGKVTKKRQRRKRY